MMLGQSSGGSLQVYLRSGVARPGARLGGYRLCFEIGAGGMATVFLAAIDGRAGVHRFVALKCLRPELACQSDFAAMFVDEARLASQIHHPNVCSVLDADEWDGVSYIAMEHVSGEALSSVRRRLADELDSWHPVIQAAMVARITADAAEGLHAAHELVDSHGQLIGVVHRDVAPDNLMLTYDGCVKVLDFGVSLCCQNRQKTASGLVKGKVSYLAPEVIQGKRPDRRSDVWALGVVAWELLTGQRLFDGATDIETLHAVSEMPIPPPSRVRRGLPIAVDKIVLGALERDPDRRYATARELGQSMNRFLANRRIAFGLAELASCMAKLFPDGRSAKRQLIETAEQLEQQSALMPAVNGVDEPVTRRSVTLAQRVRRRWLPGVAVAAAAAWLLLTGWSRWHRDEPIRPALAPPATTDTAVLLRVQMVPAGSPAAVPVVAEVTTTGR
jgi:serine/threonine-protein kinase